MAKTRNCPEKSHKVLRDLIAAAAPNCDADKLAGQLLLYHGSLAPMMESHAEDLLKIAEVPPAAARLITFIPGLTRYLACEKARRTAVIQNVDMAGEYLKPFYIGHHYEQFYLLCLSAEGRVLECNMLQQGTLDEAPFYLRHVLEAASRAGAHAVVFSHNHPGGTRRPSRADIDSTLFALTALCAMRIVLLDHIIVADSTAISMREYDPSLEEAFLAQSKTDPLLRKWLKKK